MATSSATTRRPTCGRASTTRDGNLSCDRHPERSEGSALITPDSEDRYFDPDPTVRRHARAIYETTRGLPIISPHGHDDAAPLATNDAFQDLASLIITPDHYVLRLLYSRGVPLESPGVAPID